MDVAKRECILDAAARAFARLGFKKTSIDAIAQAAGVAKGTVYLACDSKADLFYQSVHRELRGWLAEVSRMIDPRLPAGELLKASGTASIAFLEARPLVRDLFFGLHAGQIPTWADRFEELRELGQAAIAEIIRLGQRQGRFRPDLDVPRVAGILQDMHIAGYMFACQASTPDPEELKERFELSFDIILNGLRQA